MGAATFPIFPELLGNFFFSLHWGASSDISENQQSWQVQEKQEEWQEKEEEEQEEEEGEEEGKWQAKASKLVAGPLTKVTRLPLILLTLEDTTYIKCGFSYFK